MGKKIIYEELKPLLSIKELNRKQTKSVARKYAADDSVYDILNNNIVVGGKNTKQEKRFNRLVNKYYNNNLEYTKNLKEKQFLIEKAKQGDSKAFADYIRKGTNEAAKQIADIAMVVGPSLAGGGAIGAIAPDVIDVASNLMAGNYAGAGISAASAFLPEILANPTKRYIKNKTINNFLSTADVLDPINNEITFNKISYNPNINTSGRTIPWRRAIRQYDNNVVTPEVIALPQLSKSSTRNLLKDFNIKFAKRYGYDTIPLDLEFEEAKQAIQELGNRHNTFIRGVSDPKTNPRLTKGEKIWIKNSMAEKGLDWDNYDDRIKHAVEIHSPNFRNFGRADIDESILAKVDSDTGTLFNRLYNTNDYIGTSYASNSAAFGKGYDYNKGEVALLRRPFQLGDNPFDWKTDIDFILNREGGRYAARNNYDDLLYEYVTGRNLNADVAKELNVGKQINDFRHKTNKFLNSPIYNYDNFLKHINNRQLQDIKYNSSRFERYKQPDFDNDPLAKVPYKAIDSYRRKIDRLMEKYNYGYRTKQPRTIKDYIYLGSLYDNLFVHKEHLRNKRQAINNAFAQSKKLLNRIEKVKPKIKFGYESVSPISSQTYREMVLERAITDKNGKFLPRVNEFYNKIQKENEIFTNERGRYYSKSKTPYTRHYVSQGKVGTKAWDFIRYVTPDEIDGIITRQHIDTGYTPITTRKTKKLGGNEKK